MSYMPANNMQTGPTKYEFHCKILRIIYLLFLYLFILFSPACQSPPISIAEDINVLRLFPIAKLDYDDLYLSNNVISKYNTFEDAVIFKDNMILANGPHSQIHFNVFKLVDRKLSYNIRAHENYNLANNINVTVHINDNLVDSYELNNNSANINTFIRGDYLTRGINTLSFTFDKHVDLKFSKENRNDLFPTHTQISYSAIINNVSIIYDNTSNGKLIVENNIHKVFKYIDKSDNLHQKANSSFELAFNPIINPAINLTVSLAHVDASRGSKEIRVEGRTDTPEWKTLYRLEITPEINSSAQISHIIKLDEYNDSIISLRFSFTSNDYNSDDTLVWNSIMLSGVFKKKESLIDQDNYDNRKAIFKKSVKNIIVIVVDAARADYFSAYGYPEKTTPNIDSIAERGLLFTSAIASASYTISSMSSFFSSLMPEAHGVRYEDREYVSSLPNMVRSFKENGYHTTIITGHQFLGKKYGLTSAADSHYEYRIRDEYKINGPSKALSKAESAVKEARNSGKPVFIYAHFLPPHSPYNPTKKFKNAFAPKVLRDPLEYNLMIRFMQNNFYDNNSNIVNDFKRLYISNLAFADDIVGRYLSILDENNFTKDSLIIITSDHGEAFGEHGTYEHGFGLFEYLIRVPLIISYPGVNHAQVSRQIGLIDFFPTFVDLFDLNIGDLKSQFQGKSIAPLILNVHQPGDNYIYSRGSYGDLDLFSLRSEKYKYIRHINRDLLYDIKNDPNEINNLAEGLPATTLLMRMKAYSIKLQNEALKLHEDKKVDLDEDALKEIRNLGYLQ